jgi:Phosphotransferase enzyme family
MATADARPGNTPIGVPDDVTLPGAVLLQQPRRLVEVLSPLLTEWLDPGARLVDSHVVIHRYVPGKRCIFELELAFEAEDGRRESDVGLLPPSAFRLPPVKVRTVIGKLYAGDEGARAYDTLQRLWASGFSSGPFTVPRPLAYEPDWQLLLLSRVTGMALRQLLLRQATGDRRQATVGSPGSGPNAEERAPNASLGTAVERAAEWLVQLHTSGVTAGRRYTFDRHLHTLAHWQRRVTDVYPKATGPLGALLARIEAQGRALPAWEPAPTHRDFSPDHVVVDGARLSGLDFDEFCQYDPLFDVAHFVVHLRLLALTSCGMLQRFDELATRFQMAYEAHAKEYSAARVRLYEAITYVKLAHVIACITRPRGWQQSVATLLREAQSAV